MVERTRGDGIERNVMYARWRDHSPEPGYSRELINLNVDPKFYDDLGAQTLRFKEKTFLEFFEKHVRERPNDTYLGTRKRIVSEKDGK
jgi:hypothetical protein